LERLRNEEIKMFDEIHSELNNVFDTFKESIKDDFGMLIVENIFDPILRETSQLMLTQENMNNTLAELDGLREEIVALKTKNG
jgi:hypothetical protein